MRGFQSARIPRRQDIPSNPVRGIVPASDEIIEHIAAGLNSAQTIRGIPGFLVEEVDPKVFKGAGSPLLKRLKRTIPPKKAPPGYGPIFKRAHIEIAYGPRRNDPLFSMSAENLSGQRTETIGSGLHMS
jgi:hypothetical protein